MTSSQDTEITLGTGRMLLLFFGLVVVCAGFFGVGFTLGRNSIRTGIVAIDSNLPSATGPVVRPSAVKSNNGAEASADQPTYKPAVQKNVSQVPATGADSGAPPSADDASKTDSTAPSSADSYYVQVAAVSKQEDADALVEALKKKQYPAFSASNAPMDKLLHIQIGPFADIKEAEGTRAKLISDGYNPILKK